MYTSSKPRDAAIHGKWLKDRELDAYVASRGLRLVRVTDAMFKLNPCGCVRAVKEAKQ